MGSIKRLIHDLILPYLLECTSRRASVRWRSNYRGTASRPSASLFQIRKIKILRIVFLVLISFQFIFKILYNIFTGGAGCVHQMTALVDRDIGQALFQLGVFLFFTDFKKLLPAQDTFLGGSSKVLNNGQEFWNWTKIFTLGNCKSFEVDLVCFNVYTCFQVWVPYWNHCLEWPGLVSLIEQRGNRLKPS